MGARQSTDKRTARREHRATFQRGVEDFRNRIPPQTDCSAAQAAYGSGGEVARAVTVVARKRPLSPAEAAAGEFDAVTMLTDAEAEAKARADGRTGGGHNNNINNNNAFLHDGRMKFNNKVRVF